MNKSTNLNTPEGPALTPMNPISGIGKSLCEKRLIAVLVIDDAEDAVPVARALLAGGVDAMELTLRTPVALEAVTKILTEAPEMTVGIGTILTLDHLRSAISAGAHFGVSPGVNPEIIKEARRIGFAFGPGIMTPTDIDAAIREGCRLLKFFPSESSGGLVHLKNIAAPFLHLGPKFIPLGGITIENLESYIASDLVGAVGGSWLAPRQTIAEKDFQQIEKNAREARRIVDG